MKAVVAAFNQEKALVGALSVITNLRICFGWNFLKHYKEALAAVLTRHVVAGAALRGRDVPPGATQLTTAGGEEVTLTRDKFIQVASSAGQAYVVLLVEKNIYHKFTKLFFLF